MVTKEDLNNFANICASKAFRKDGERYAAGNDTTYPRKHYYVLEKEFGILNASQLTFFNRMYTYWMRLLTYEESGTKANTMIPETTDLNW